MEPNQLRYRNWTISVLPACDRWQFSCRPPNGEVITYPKTYTTSGSALKAGKKFVGCMIFRCWVGDLLDYCLETRLLAHWQYEQINRLISLIFRARFLVQPEDDRTQPEQLERNPHDSMP